MKGECLYELETDYEKELRATLITQKTTIKQLVIKISEFISLITKEHTHIQNIGTNFKSM